MSAIRFCSRVKGLRRVLAFFASGVVIAGLVVTIPIAVGLATLAAPGAAYATTVSFTCSTSCPNATIGSNGYAYPYFNIAASPSNGRCTLYYSGPSGSYRTSVTCSGTTDVGISTAGSWHFYVHSCCNGAGQADSSTITVNVSYPPPTLSCSSNCSSPLVGATVTFSATYPGYSSYTWNYECPGASGYSAVTGETTSSPAQACTTAGTGHFYIADGAGASSTVSVTWISPTPTLTCSSNCSPQVGGTVTFSATYPGSTSYTWNTECPGASGYTSTSGETTSSPTVTCTTAGIGSFYITDSGGRSSTVSVTWTAPVPTASLTCASSCPNATMSGGWAYPSFNIATSNANTCTLLYSGSPGSYSVGVTCNGTASVGIGAPGTWKFYLEATGAGGTTDSPTISVTATSSSNTIFANPGDPIDFTATTTTAVSSPQAIVISSSTLGSGYWVASCVATSSTISTCSGTLAQPPHVHLAYVQALVCGSLVSSSTGTSTCDNPSPITPQITVYWPPVPPTIPIL